MSKNIQFTKNTLREVKYSKYLEIGQVQQVHREVKYNKCIDRAHRERSSTTRPSTEVKFINFIGMIAINIKKKTNNNIDSGQGGPEQHRQEEPMINTEDNIDENNP